MGPASPDTPPDSATRLPFTPMRSVNAPLAPTLLTLGVLAAAPVHSAAAPVLDDTPLVEGLVERRLDLLLDHLAESGTFTDPSVPRMIEIGRLRAAYLDPTRPAAQRRERLAQADAAWRELLRNPGFAGHPQMPVWRTQYAEQRLVYGLDVFERSAADFYELGVPTAAQRAAFEAIVPDALAELQQAERDFRDLSQRVSRDAALKNKLESSLAFYRIFDDYRDQKTRFYAARARYLATLLPDALAPETPRRQLLQEAADGLSAFLQPGAAGAGLRLRAQSLVGRVAAAAGRHADAQQMLSAVADAPAGGPEALTAAIARAVYAGGAERVARLATLAQKASVLQQPTARLLVADARFRTLRHTGQSEAAYGVYLDLLNDPALGDRAAALRQVIYDRWAAELGPDDDPAAFPPAARLGVADISRRRGLAARAAGDDAAAVVALKRAVRAAVALADDPDAPPALIAAGRYQRAYANSILQPRNLAVLLEAINEATAVARDHAALPVATDAITLASSLAESLHRGHAERPGVTPAFLATAQVLFDSGQFDTTRAADDRRLYATRVRLQDAGHYARAAQSYARQLPGHPHYAAAQSRRAEALVAQWRGATDAERTAIAAAARDAVSRTDAAAGDDPARQPDRARARLAEAELEVLVGDPGRAFFVLDRYEQQFADRPDLMPAVLQRRILLRVDQGDLSRAQEDAATMMARFPDGAAAVIGAVLNDLETRLVPLADDRRAAAVSASGAAALAKLLADWARDRGLDAREMLPYDLVVLKSLRIGGRPDEALAYLGDTGLKDNFPNHADVLLERARVLAGSGDPVRIREARPLLNRLLKALAEPYPDAYWQAWITRMQVSLALDEGVDELPRRVRLLEARNPDLGGPATAAKLRALAAEAAGRIGQR